MPKHNDVCRWKYKDTKGNFAYWCKSKIAIYNAKKQRWFDTYWGSTSDRFSFCDADSAFEKNIVANLDEYEKCSSYDLDYYDETDTLNLSHANNRGVYYLRIGAVKSVDKIRSALQSQLEEAQAKKLSAEYEIERISKKLENVTLDTWI